MRVTKRSRNPTIQPGAGRFAYEGLDRVFHEKARLGIMTSLTTQPDGLSFSDLKALCALSDGNLNCHLAVLQEAGFVKTKKEGRGRSSHTLCVVTRRGQAAFLQYLRELERVIADAAKSTTQPARSTNPLRAGWSAS
jgi:DNA-binding MarR family transcriptional regulator